MHIIHLYYQLSLFHPFFFLSLPTFFLFFWGGKGKKRLEIRSRRVEDLEAKEILDLCHVQRWKLIRFSRSLSALLILFPPLTLKKNEREEGSETLTFVLNILLSFTLLYESSMCERCDTNKTYFFQFFFFFCKLISPSLVFLNNF